MLSPEAFWSTSPQTTDTAHSSDGWTNSSLSISPVSETDQSVCSRKLSSPPPICDVRPFIVEVSEEEKLHIAVHDGYQCTPTYNTPREVMASQAAIFEYETPCKQLLSPKTQSSMKKPIDFCERELFNLDMDDSLDQVQSSHKNLFGANGWLGGTSDFGNRSREKQKPKSLKDLRKKIIEGFAERMAKASQTIGHESPGTKGRQPQPTIPISLGPPMQAMLYSELEVMICVSANKFLVQQCQEGRLPGESVKKIKEFWGSKNRPQVVEFQFDQATQQRLITENKKSLRFYGESSTNPVLLNSNLHNWKAIVKEMSIRTFCAPDSVIRKHLHEVYKLLDMLGAPLVTLAIFQKLHMRTLSLMGGSC
ncbi:hypothetical protein BDV28DRAFT_156408 [Aspergillus coremiiformis]|uniref:Uncharacterized protein n=1 Tax=Aspergillus coremiiformis TaxID=138285 RepID=A0A5N6Z9S5_9EURO|nr:hypothetical protein BDV28DRAFT_156408 [Aspergillus coremiiformis]